MKDPGAWDEVLFVPWEFGVAPFPDDVDRAACEVGAFDGPAVKMNPCLG